MNSQFLNQKTPNEIAKSLANKIKERRKKLKISQENLAQKSGVSLRTIQQYETHARDISKASGQTLMMLARALECSVEDIVDSFNKFL